MRRKFAFGLGIAGVLTGAGVGVAQIPTGPVPSSPTAPASPVTPPAPPALPPGVQPAGSSYVPPVGGVTPAASPFAGIAPVDPARPPAPPPPTDLTIRSALGPNHPWAVKPEDGPYFICVKSYSRPSRPVPGDNGPSARAMAEELATEIRDLYRVQAFLYEYVSEERKAEAAAIAAARERARLFASQLDKYRQEAKLKGMIFLEEERVKVHYKTVNYQDQIAVLVGPFQSDKDAREALEKVRTWLPPKNVNLMDGAAFTQRGPDGKPVVVGGHLNPYLTAHVVPNPTVPKEQATDAAGFDPFIAELNDGRPYNLLKATKGWTLAVKSFSTPVQFVSKDAPTKTGFMQKLLGDKPGSVLQAGAGQAEQLAEALRAMTDPQGNSLNLEAFVLHTRSASLVTIGQFDGPNDPSLTATRRLLASINPKVTEDKAGTKPVMNAPSLFGEMMPIPIPKP